MATPTGFVECNAVLGPPPGDDGRCLNLPIRRAPVIGATGSVWELTPEEIEVITQTRKVYLCVFMGGMTQPPVYLCPYAPGVPESVEVAF